MRVAGLALVLLVAGGATGAAAAQTPESWMVVGMQGGAMGWETRGMTRDPGKNAVSVQRLTYFATPKPFGDSGYSFMLQHITFSCGEHKFQLGDASIKDANGKVLGEGAPQTVWRDVRERTPESLLEGVVCRGDIVENTHTFSGLDAAMAGAKTIALP